MKRRRDSVSSNARSCGTSPVQQARMSSKREAAAAFGILLPIFIVIRIAVFLIAKYFLKTEKKNLSKLMIARTLFF
jgi:hypothetical protein